VLSCRDDGLLETCHAQYGSKLNLTKRRVLSGSRSGANLCCIGRIRANPLAFLDAWSDRCLRYTIKRHFESAHCMNVQTCRSIDLLFTLSVMPPGVREDPFPLQIAFLVFRNSHVKHILLPRSSCVKVIRQGWNSQMYFMTYDGCQYACLDRPTFSIMAGYASGLAGPNWRSMCFRDYATPWLWNNPPDEAT
jgi:hypothetical protein